MNKTTFFTAVILSFGLLSAQAADKVLFEDSSFSKEGWSEFAEIPGTGGWEVKRRELGELAQAVVQEVTLEGSRRHFPERRGGQLCLRVPLGRRDLCNAIP